MAENTPVVAEETQTYLSDYPAKFNDTVIPFFYGQESFAKVQTTSQSESGKDLVQITRDSKLTIPCSFKVADRAWVKIFKEFSLLRSFTLSLYDVIADNYVTYTVRIEDYTHNRVRKSQELTAVKGVWEVAFNIVEF